MALSIIPAAIGFFGLSRRASIIILSVSVISGLLIVSKWWQWSIERQAIRDYEIQAWEHAEAVTRGNREYEANLRREVAVSGGLGDWYAEQLRKRETKPFPFISAVPRDTETVKPRFLPDCPCAVRGGTSGRSETP